MMGRSGENKIYNLIHVSFLISEKSSNASSTRVNDYQALPSDSNNSLRSFYSRAPPIGDIDTDETSDDEFILYVDDDKKHILKS